MAQFLFVEDGDERIAVNLSRVEEVYHYHNSDKTCFSWESVENGADRSFFDPDMTIYNAAVALLKNGLPYTTISRDKSDDNT